ncbi:MAG: alanine racemase [Candidatus Omnitrophica bacterium]|nr:alanine racemase [Candidatus Omnitrophota bacterium]
MSGPIMRGRPTWIEVDLAAVRSNLGVLRDVAGPGVSILGVVKSNAYGHGLVEVARTLSGQGIEFLGVSNLDEALVLRESGIQTPILVLGPIEEGALPEIIGKRICPTVVTPGRVKELQALAAKYGEEICVHVKVDTGMGRLGVRLESAQDLIRQVSEARGLRCEGIYTHFACADMDMDFTRVQIEHFQKLLSALGREGRQIRHVHSANSAATLRWPWTHFNMVRPGLALYGLRPGPLPEAARYVSRLKPALSFKTRISGTKFMKRGESISYGRTQVLRRDSWVGILPVGYADGYPFAAAGRAQVLIGGRRVPVLGRITMDLMAVDLGSQPLAGPGEEVVLLGRQGFERLGAEEFATWAHTIPYEIVCGWSHRLPRHFVGAEEASGHALTAQSSVL